MKTQRHNKRRHERGFSLIETLVYLAVMVLAAGAVVTTYLSLDTVLVRNKTDRELTHAATVSMERMVRSIQSADSVNTGLSTLGTSPGVLTLEHGTTTTRFFMSGSELKISENGVDKGALTSNAVEVESLTFTRYTNSATELVRVALTLSASSKAASSTRTFYTSAVLRNSYE